MNLASLLLALVLSVPTLAAAAARSDAADETDALLAAKDFSGVVLVRRNGKDLFHRAYGKASIEWDVDVRLDTTFRIASITKLFTAVVVARLAELGKIDYDATIDTYLPDYAGEGGAVVTVHQLLTHTSGIANSDTVKSLEEAEANGIPMYQLPASPRALVDRYASGKLVAKPGSAFDYNNADFLILGRIIEAVAGESYERAVRRHVLDVAGLAGTGMMNWKRLTPAVATGYLRTTPDASFIHEIPFFHENSDAAGGLYSTAREIARFSDALFAGRIIRRESLERILAVDKEEYGHGLWVAPIVVNGKKDRVAHRPGSVMGANTVLLRYVDDGLTVVMLSNTNATPIDEVAFEIARTFSRK